MKKSSRKFLTASGRQRLTVSPPRLSIIDPESLRLIRYSWGMGKSRGMERRMLALYSEDPDHIPAPLPSIS